MIGDVERLFFHGRIDEGSEVLKSFQLCVLLKGYQLLMADFQIKAQFQRRDDFLEPGCGGEPALASQHFDGRLQGVDILLR